MVPPILRIDLVEPVPWAATARNVGDVPDASPIACALRSRPQSYCGRAETAAPAPSGPGGEPGMATPGLAPPGAACPPSGPPLGMKIWIFVCARRPVSPGFSMLD